MGERDPQDVNPENAESEQIPALLDLPPTFAKDLALFRDFSNRWVKSILTDPADLPEDAYTFYSNTSKSALNTELILLNGLRENGVKLVFTDDATDYMGNQYETGVRVSSAHGLYDEATNPLVHASDLVPSLYRVRGQVLKNPYRLAAAIAVSDYSRLTVYEPSGLRQRDITPLLRPLSRLGSEAVKALIPRLFMTGLLSYVLPREQYLEKGQGHMTNMAQTELDYYEGLADRGVRPFGIEEIHGAINGIAREAVETIPDLLAAA